MNKAVKIIGYGAVVWLATFIEGFLLYTQAGEPRLNLELTFNIFMLTTLLVGLALLAVYFKSLSGDYIREGIVIGVSWQVLHTLLDLFILLPLFDMKISTWWLQIGSGHFILPMMAIAMGVVAQQKSSS